MRLKNCAFVADTKVEIYHNAWSEQYKSNLQNNCGNTHNISLSLTHTH